MIRIEGIPLVAARLSAAAEVARVRETALVYLARMRQRPGAAPSTTYRGRRRQAHEQICA
jgi:hypothetical protein